MDKKKAIKIIGATTMAATAFVATSPQTDAATASQTEELVQRAKEAGTVLKWAISMEGSADGTTRPWAQYNAAKDARDKAVAAINTLAASQKASLLAQIDENVNLHISRAMHYIDAITAGEKIKEKQSTLDAQIEQGLINDDTEKAYHELSKEIRKQGVLLDRVYGKSTRDTIREQYKFSAEDVRDSVKYAVTVKIELDLMNQALVANNQAEAEKHFAEVEKYIDDVENAAMKATLVAKKVALEAQLAPAVTSVSAVDASTIQVTFNKAMEVGTDTNGAENIANYLVNGSALTSADTVELSKDGKVATLNLVTTANLTKDTAYTITVDKDIKTKNGQLLGSVDFKTSLFFVDNENPTITKVEGQTNGDLKITFNEKVVAGTPSVIVNGVTVTPNAVVGNTVTITKANLAAANLENGKSYSIYVNGYNDLVANSLTLYTSTFTYNVVADVVAPAVNSVVAKDEKTLTLVFSEAINGVTMNGSTDNAATIGLTVKKGTNVISTTATTTDGKTFTLNLDPTDNVLFNSANKEVSVGLEVTVEGFKDGALNVGQKAVNNVIVAKDAVAPTLVKSEYDYANEKFVLTFNEGLSADAVKTALAVGVTIVDSEGVAHTAPTAAQISAITAGDKTVEIDNSTATGLKLPAGTYTFQIAKNVVKDQSLNGGNGNGAFSTTVTVATSTPTTDTTKPNVVSITETAKDELTVVFSEPIKGGSVVGSATAAANYTLGGSVLSNDAIITLNVAKDTATIKLPAGSISKSENVLFTTMNVQDLAGNVLDTTTKVVPVTDSKQPVLSSAKVNGNGALVLSFSEDVDGKLDTGSHVDPVVGDFIIKVNGVTVSDGVLAAGATDQEVIITSAGTSFASGTITVEVKSETRTTTDAEGNTLTVGTLRTATR